MWHFIVPCFITGGRCARDAAICVRALQKYHWPKGCRVGGILASDWLRSCQSRSKPGPRSGPTFCTFPAELERRGDVLAFNFLRQQTSVTFNKPPQWKDTEKSGDRRALTQTVRPNAPNRAVCYRLRHVCFELRKPTCGTTPSRLRGWCNNWNGLVNDFILTSARCNDASCVSYLLSSHSLSDEVDKTCRVKPLKAPVPLPPPVCSRITQLNFSQLHSPPARAQKASHCACASNDPDL